MQKWTKKHARFVGRVIFANFLKLPLGSYKSIIEEVESSTLFKKLSRDGGNHKGKRSAIIIERLSRASISCWKRGWSSKAIAKVAKSNKAFSVRYTHDGFNKTYSIRRTPHLKLFYKLRRISSRNDLTHKVIKGVIEHQNNFLSTGNPIDLVPFSQIQLVKWLNGNQSSKVDISWISRVVNSISVITPSGEERILKSFFPTRRDINKRLIKQLLDKENEYIESGRLKRRLTDNQIMVKLEEEYGLLLSRCTVGHCRKDMGIPSAKGRLSGYKYPPLSGNFSVPYPLTIESVQSNAPSCAGIYEFRLRGKEIEYPNGKTNVVYIGRTMNIKKRLREHLGRRTKNHHIKGFLKKERCLFRYIQLSKDWKKEEGNLYNLFVTTYGAPPNCNRVRP